MGILKWFVFLLGIQLSKSKIQTINVHSDGLEWSKLFCNTYTSILTPKNTICRKEQE